MAGLFELLFESPNPTARVPRPPPPTYTPLQTTTCLTAGVRIQGTYRTAKCSRAFTGLLGGARVRWPTDRSPCLPAPKPASPDSPCKEKTCPQNPTCPPNRFYLLFQQHTTPALARRDGLFGGRGYSRVALLGPRLAVALPDQRAERTEEQARPLLTNACFQFVPAPALWTCIQCASKASTKFVFVFLLRHRRGGPLGSQMLVCSGAVRRPLGLVGAS